MIKINLKRFLKRVLAFILIMLIILSVFPYLVPLSKEAALSLPYENSALFTAGETTIHYRTYAPQGDSYLGYVVMIHGLGGSTFSYEQNAPTLAAQGYYVITLDLPGFGYSSRKSDEDHSQKHRAELVWQCLDQVEAQANTTSVAKTPIRWHLAGHSMGGGTVAAMAYQEPERTESIIFVDGALFENDRGGLGDINLFSIPMIERWVQVALEHVIINEKRIQTFLESAYGQTPTDEQVTGYLKPLKVEGTARAAASLLKTAENLPESALATITTPAMAIWGVDDQWVPISQTKRLNNLMPQLEIIAIEGAGHCPMETHAEIFNEFLLGWLAKF